MQIIISHYFSLKYEPTRLMPLLAFFVVHSCDIKSHIGGTWQPFTAMDEKNAFIRCFWLKCVFLLFGFCWYCSCVDNIAYIVWYVAIVSRSFVCLFAFIAWIGGRRSSERNEQHIFLHILSHTSISLSLHRSKKSFSYCKSSFWQPMHASGN